jgi:hypothetical protein
MLTILKRLRSMITGVPEAKVIVVILAPELMLSPFAYQAMPYPFLGQQPTPLELDLAKAIHVFDDDESSAVH